MNPSSDDLDQYFISEKSLEQPDDSFSLKGIDRRVARNLQRGGEVIAGLPGDIVNLVRSFVPSELPEQELEKQPFLVRKGRELLESLPTSAEFRARGAEKFPQLEPQTPFQEMEEEFVQDFTSLAIPVKGKIPFSRALGISALGNIGKQAAKEAGFTEGVQDASKLGLMIFGGMFGGGRGVKNYIKNLYKESGEFVPQGEKVAYNIKKLNEVDSLLSKGSVTSAKEQAIKLSNDIKSKIKNGLMDFDEALQFDIDINRAITEAGKDKQKVGYLKQLQSAHAQTMEEYGKQNPSFYEKWKEAKQAFKGIETSENIKDYIRKNANLKNLVYGSALLGIQEAALPGNTAIKLGSLGATATTLYAAEMAKRLTKNPALRRYYQNVLNASLSENKAMLTRNLAGLERVAKKEFEENPLPVFDIED